jgi:hypothetical protein
LWNSIARVGVSRRWDHAAPMGNECSCCLCGVGQDFCMSGFSLSVRSVFLLLHAHGSCLPPRVQQSEQETGGLLEPTSTFHRPIHTRWTVSKEARPHGTILVQGSHLRDREAILRGDGLRRQPQIQQLLHHVTSPHHLHVLFSHIHCDGLSSTAFQFSVLASPLLSKLFFPSVVGFHFVSQTFLALHFIILEFFFI